MGEGRPGPVGAAAGALAVVLFLIGAALMGDRPTFGEGGEFTAYLDDNRTRVQLACAANAAAVPLLIWFLVTVTEAAGEAARRTASLAQSCGIAYVAVFVVDTAMLAAAALRPERDPGLLLDLEWMTIGTATFLGTALLAAMAVVALRHAAVWPRWVGWLAAFAALAYSLRIGTLFTTEGAFAADGLLGRQLPVAALVAWLLASSVVLTRRLTR